MSSRDILEQLLARNEPRVRAAFLESIAELVNGVQITKLVAALESGSVAAALDALNITESAYGPLLEATRSAFVDAGRETAGGIAGATDEVGYNVRVRFDTRDLPAEEWLRRISSTRIVEISEAQREAVRIALTQGMERGLNPNTVALDIVGRIPPGSNTRQGGLIGLDSTKLAWVQNAREELESGDPARMAAYLQRERRDRNLDGIVERAIAAERPPTRAEIQRLTARYSDRLLKLRGDTIGRTEAMQALNAGQFQAYAQAVKAGRLPADAITKRWKTAADGDRVRDSHRDLHNDEIPFTEDFRTRYGSAMAHPGDTSKGAKKRDIINCRCICEYRVDFIKARLGAKVREEPTDRPPPRAPRPTLAQALRDINRKARKSVMDNGRRTGVEHLLFVDARTGKSPTKGTRGVYNEVDFTPDMLRLADDPTQKIIVHHNHPSSSSLSYADLWQIQNRPGLYEIYAHGHNGNEFRAREISRRLTQEVHNLVKERTRLVVQSRISALGRSGDVDKARRLYDRATILHSHGINLAYGRNGLMRYRARFAKDTRDTLNEFADMMDDVAKAADDALHELLGEL